MRLPRLVLRLAASATVLMVATNTLPAQTAEKFYAGRTINLVVPYGPGGYYDLGARLMARHLGRHVPGNPHVIVQNQPSAGGIGLANRFASGADNDGTMLGALQRAVPQYAFVGYQTTKFDPAKLSWIGSLSAYANDSYVMVVNSDHPATSLAALRGGAIKTRLGAGRSGSANLIYALVAKELLKLNFDIVRGYEGNAPIFLAQQRGEVDGLFSDFSTIKATEADQWSSKKILPVVQFGRRTRLPELAEVPTARELVTDPTDSSFLAFAEMPFFIALPIAGPTGIPADRLAALQQGFTAMAIDEEFLSDAKSMHFDVDPISGAAVVQAIAQAAETPPDVMARFKALVSQ